MILGAGSRGDLQPCLALGRRLTERGDGVRMIAVARYKPLVDAAGLVPVMLSLDPVEIIASEAGRAWLDGGRNPVRFLRSFALEHHCAFWNTVGRSAEGVPGTGAARQRAHQAWARWLTGLGE